MTYTTYSASQAVARANAQTFWPTARCLEFVMHCVNGEQVGLYDANAAWAAARQKVTTGTPPAGAPVYFSGYAHGHIAVSLGGGRIRSTDEPSLGRVANTTIGDIERDWGIRYLGWSRDYAGLVIRGLEDTSTNYSGTPPLPVTPTPTPVPEEADMPLNDADKAWIVQTIQSNRNWANENLRSTLPELTAQAVHNQQIGGRDYSIGTAVDRGYRNAEAGLAATQAVAVAVSALAAAVPGLSDDSDVKAITAKLDELKALLATLPKA